LQRLRRLPWLRWRRRCWLPRLRRFPRLPRLRGRWLLVRRLRRLRGLCGLRRLRGLLRLLGSVPPVLTPSEKRRCDGLHGDGVIRRSFTRRVLSQPPAVTASSTFADDDCQQRLICPTGCLVNFLSRLLSKNFPLPLQLKSVLCPARPALMRGTYASSRTLRRDAMDAAVRGTKRACRGRRSRVVPVPPI